MQKVPKMVKMTTIATTNCFSHGETIKTFPNHVLLQTLAKLTYYVSLGEVSAQWANIFQVFPINLLTGGFKKAAFLLS